MISKINRPFTDKRIGVCKKAKIAGYWLKLDLLSGLTQDVLMPEVAPQLLYPLNQ